MQQIKFSTNLKCDGCIQKVKPDLDNLEGLEKWEVDLQSPERVLTAELDDRIPAEKLVEALAKSGYKAIPIDRS